MSHLATLVRRAIASSTLGTGSTEGVGHQHLRTLRYHTNAVLLHMAAVLPGHHRIHVGLLHDIFLYTTDTWLRNWSSAMFGGVLIIAIIYYVFKGRHDYAGPVMIIKRE